jgi:hypothetical protein
VNEFRGKVVEAIRLAAAGRAEVRLLDPVEAVCATEFCPLVIDGVAVTTDTNHLAVRAAARMGEFYESDLEWLSLRPNRQQP